jgi:hypothetical protein
MTMPGFALINQQNYVGLAICHYLTQKHPFIILLSIDVDTSKQHR